MIESPRAKFGICAPVFDGAAALRQGPKIEEIRKLAMDVESLGYDSLWAPDHFILGHGGSILECWTTLSSLASITEKVKIGPLVLSYSHRSPSLLAKMAATLDYISGGRLILGMGAGWHASEQLSYGLPWEENPRKRIEMMREAIALILRMWQGEETTFVGKYYTVEKAICRPRPIQEPHPPIWIGGGGEKYLLKVVAELADGWNVPAMSPAEYAHKLSVLRDHCKSLGTNYDKIEKSMETRLMIVENVSETQRVVKWLQDFRTMMAQSSDLRPKTATIEEVKETYIIGSVDECRERINEYIRAGVQHFTIYLLDLPSSKTLNGLAQEIIPKL